MDAAKVVSSPYERSIFPCRGTARQCDGHPGVALAMVADDRAEVVGRVTYQYDDLNRLTRENCQNDYSSHPNYEYKYWFDAVGNRTKMYYGSVIK